MRVLIAGAGGLLGGAVAREFAASADVVALDRRSLDVTDRDAVSSTLAGVHPDVVINCAAYNNVDRAEDEPVRALEINAFAAHVLARAAASAGAAFVHYSSDFVFDGEIERPYAEDDRPNPQSVYGASKLLGDWLALECPRGYVLRVESLFGPPVPGGRRGSLGTIVDRIRAREEVPVFVDRVVSPTYTPDIARATRRLIECGAAPGLYHCVNGGSATWLQVAERVAVTLGLPLSYTPLTLATAGLRARRPRYCALSNAKLAAAAYAMPPWQDALAEFLADDA